VEIPFSKSEIFVSQSLSFKEKRQLVRVIGFCLQGYDVISGKEITSKIINSTHAYEKLDTTLTKDEITMLLDFKDKPIREFLEQLGIETHLQNILYFAIGSFEESQVVEGNIATTFEFFERV
jgi:RAB protein geranylgeranyltransferase component A